MYYQAGHLTLIDHMLYLNGDSKPINLSPMESRLLATLMRHPDQTVSRAMLMREVWQTTYLGDTRTLNVHICFLRRKLEQDPSRPRLIVTQRGVGYRLCVLQARAVNSPLKIVRSMSQGKG